MVSEPWNSLLEKSVQCGGTHLESHHSEAKASESL